jgi:3'-phosphoadenosine 5'-phosphosulfate sulfotransferase (PAPS reductase)/FAD synthetase
MRDPFKIDGPACISFSGGRTSGYMLWRILQAHGGTLPANVAVCFANTGKEEEATLQFIHECSQRWGVHIHWVEYADTGYAAVNFETASRRGEPFEALIRKRGFLPNPVTRFCTQELKIRPMARHLAALGFEGTKDDLENFSVMGIRADEPRRAAKVADKSRIPLFLAGNTVLDVAAFWDAQEFNLQLPSYGGRTLHGNCDLCFLKPASQIASLVAEKPERAVWWASMEHLASTEFADKVKGDGWRFRMDRPSYQALKDFARDQRDMFDPNEEAIACFCGD